MRAQPLCELVEVPELAERDAELEEAEMVDREQRVPALVALPTHHSFDRVVVGDERGDLRLGDPFEE